MEEYENIELRSEKVKAIIGKIPAPVIRSGITFLTLLLTGFMMAAAYIPYPENLAVNVEIIDPDSLYTGRAVALIPYTYITHIHEDLPVRMEMQGYDACLYGTVEGKIIHIDKEVLKRSDEHFFKVTIAFDLFIPGKKIDIKGGMAGRGYILLSHNSILKHIGDRILK